MFCVCHIHQYVNSSLTMCSCTVQHFWAQLKSIYFINCVLTLCFKVFVTSEILLNISYFPCASSPSCLSSLSFFSSVSLQDAVFFSCGDSLSSKGMTYLTNSLFDYRSPENNGVRAEFILDATNHKVIIK